MENFTEQKGPLGLYDPQFEHDACGIGAVVDIKGRKSHQTVSDALSIVERLEHRAGKDAEGKTGDGVGIMLQISHRFFAKVADELNISLGNEREYGVGMFFFPQNEHLRAQAMKLFELVTRKEGLEFLAWREVPVDPDAVGQKARDCMPAIWQCFIKKPAKVSKGINFDRKLYIVRRVFEQASNGTYVPSLSSRTIVYKGMFLVHDLRQFYLDLQDEDYESAIGMVHSRFSTNTNPSWMRAHPNRFILHNGEINTIKGNTDAMLAREETISSPIMKEDMNKILPIINTSGSDSAMLDNALEFMVMNGMDLPLAVMITIPEPWENNKNISQKKRDFYQYYATMLEPWDGPAAILFSDGDVVGAVLDRNGLRPSRYYITKDGRMILSSEVGVLPCEPENILVKDRLRPGKMLLVDTVKGEVVDDEKLKEYYASREPYGEWIDRNLVQLKDLKIPNIKTPSYTGDDLLRLQKVFGYKYEDISTLILPMARQGAEPSGAMGTDTPLAVLSGQHPPLFNYFKQRFAQVTNPPIDAIREKIVTSTSVYVGAHGNLLEDKPENCKVLKVNNPILTSTDLLRIKYMNVPGFKVSTVSINYYKNTSLEKAIDRVFLEVDRAYKEGANIIILSDRDIDEYHVAIPSLLAVSAVSQYLIRTKKSTALALILESAEPHEVHHFAALLGYGACAVNPYLAHETIGQLIDDGLLDKDYYAAVDDYNKAVLGGIVKIASKMGISTIQSYQSSQIFEAVGISRDVIDKYFTGTVSRVGRTDLLHVKPAPADSRMSKMDLDCILHNPAIVNSNVHFQKEDTYDFHLEDTLDMKVLMKKFKLNSKTPQSVKLDVSNTDRAFGAIFGSEITRKYGSDLPDDVYTVHCTGAGGQSFGAFIPKGLTLELTGDCNDYMGKGLSGGKLVVRPPEGITFKPEENIIIGNVALYGATSGKAFVSGVAGERFCVRNSGAVAVVEGVGDHGCEYMTGGTVVVLGQTGKNFAAGMTGGIAYVLDENWDFYQRVNKETVSLEPVEHKYDVATLKELIREHVELTGSPRGKEILDNFSEFLPKFKKVLPYDYDHMLRVIASMEERGLDGEQAQIEAFYAVQKNK